MPHRLNGLYGFPLSTYCRAMKPDQSYQQLQAKRFRLIESNDQSGERTKLEKQLEKRFMSAWGLGPDRLRLGYKLRESIRLFRMENDSSVRGFDHCTYYTGPNDQRIIVSQPYNCSADEIKQDLTLHNGVSPEVIDASEWGFYFPTSAGLFIVKFPFGFREAMISFEKALRRAEVDKLLKRRESESLCFSGADE
jgi:hypothetical protein